ncbi:MAG: hypothetical protein RLZ98_43, partial [Pseudomonadota bacterium]
LIAALVAGNAEDVGGEVPPAVGELERHLVLTSLVMRWSEAMRDAALEAPPDSPMQLYSAAGAQTAAQAIGLARELASLMDMVETENVSLGGLDSIVPDEYSEHWQRTLKFLEIVLVTWPHYLEEKGFISPAGRRNALVLAEAARIAKRKSGGPVIVAGVTGSIPATAELMRVVARLESGAIVLPGLDTVLDDESFEAISPAAPGATPAGKAALPGHPEHPQFGLKKLIDAIGVSRRDVGLLQGCRADEQVVQRLSFISEAMRPAQTTDRWHSYVRSANQDAVRAALQAVSLIEAGSAGEEAEIVSLILRKTAEEEGRTAALVTRDRLLARRVAVRLEAWGIRVDDSAGRPFAKTLPGTFLDLIVETVQHRFAPVPLMALLKHPLARLGLAAGDIRRAARALELAVFRTVYLGRGIEGVQRGLASVADGEERHAGVRRVKDEHFAAAEDLVERLAIALGPLEALFDERGKIDLSVLVKGHMEAAEALARLAEDEDDRPVSSPLWDGEAGTTAQLIVAGLLDEALPTLRIDAEDYPDFYRSIAVREAVRPRVPVHPRLSIWGPFEARLQQPDVVILGGLNEGSWPEAADPGPWLNRPMRQQLGLPQPEERIGHACHDFTALLGAREVYLTRAVKVDGAPAVPSRWLMRIRALAEGVGVLDALEPELPWVGWAANRSAVGAREYAKPPKPAPPVDVRPRSMSVSDVERWVQNPYAIYASKILNLQPLTALGTQPNAALRGSLIHAALSEFGCRYPNQLPDDAKAELLDIAREILARWSQDNRIAAFWVPRFQRFADWFADSETGRRKGTTRLLVEVDGDIMLDGPAGPFSLKARADRIDLRSDGVVITDYKTMSVQSLKTLAKQAAAGDAPQLPLEAAIALLGGFRELGKVQVAGLAYISASGAEPPGAEEAVVSVDVETLAREAQKGLERLIAQFDDPSTPYAALRRSRFSYMYDDYALLARVGEWAGSVGQESE